MCHAADQMRTSFRQQLFSFDLRSLALFRVGLALLILGDLIHRSFDLRAFYTDFGVLPRWVLAQASDRCLSLHYLGGSLEFQVALFLIAASFALMLLIGYRTRLATLVSWMFVVSLHERNFLVLQGGDDLLRLLLFWSMFLPLGARWSVDHALSEPTPLQDNRYRSMGSIALGAQVLLLYWGSALYKIGQPVWWEEGAGIYYALHLDYMATQMGHWLRESLSMGTMKILAYGLIFVEFLGSFLLVCTSLRSPWRFLGIGIIVGMHVGFSLGLEVGIFPFVAFTAILAFFPTWFWEKTMGWFQPREKGMIRIYYDAECSFCKKSVSLLRSFLCLPAQSVKPAQSNTAVCVRMEEQNSWVVVDSSGKEHFKFDAGLVIFRHSLWPKALAWIARLSGVVTALIILLALAGLSLPDFLAGIALLSGLALLISLLPLALLPEKKNAHRRYATGTMIYQWVANHRELMGRMTAWLRWRPPTTYPKTAGQIIALLFLSYIVLWNLNDIKNHLNFVQRLGVESESINSKHTFMPRSLAWIGRLTRIDQMWNMFDDPPKNDRWLVMPGKLADGSEVDLFSRNNGSPNFDKPKLPSAQYPRFRWRKYMENILLPKFEDYLLRYGQFVCREWDRTHPSNHLQTFEIVFVQETTTVNGPASPVRITRWMHYCVEPMQHDEPEASNTEVAPPNPNE